MNPQKQVEIVLKKCLEVYPANGKKHNKFFKSLIKDNSITEEMANVITKIIENPNLNYKIKANGLLKIENKVI